MQTEGNNKKRESSLPTHIPTKVLNQGQRKQNSSESEEKQYA